jgi:hypothetical protein
VHPAPSAAPSAAAHDRIWACSTVPYRCRQARPCSCHRTDVSVGMVAPSWCHQQGPMWPQRTGTHVAPAHTTPGSSVPVCVRECTQLPTQTAAQAALHSHTVKHALHLGRAQRGPTWPCSAACRILDTSTAGACWAYNPDAVTRAKVLWRPVARDTQSHQFSSQQRGCCTVHMTISCLVCCPLGRNGPSASPAARPGRSQCAGPLQSDNAQKSIQVCVRRPSRCLPCCRPCLLL